MTLSNDAVYAVIHIVIEKKYNLNETYRKVKDSFWIK